MSTRGRILTLTTDFGTNDGYVGAIKGAVLSLAPGTAIHDISHHVPPHDIWSGAWCLRRAARQFPAGTTHLVVVDPDVGSSRACVVIETERYLLVGPDNGVLTLAARDDGIRSVIEVNEETELWRKSETFDGLSLFAPVAGHLLSGMTLEEVGQEAEDLVELPERQATLQGNTIQGTVMYFDHFGNAITDIPARMLEGQQVMKITIKTRFDGRVCNHYGELAGAAIPGCLINSDGYLEVALYADSVRERLQLEMGDSVQVMLRAR